MAKRLLIAKALHWDSCNVYVRCPLCKGKHRHGMSGAYQLGNTRAPHCPPEVGLPSLYEIRFPIDEATGWAAYWIHKESKMFYAVTEEPEPEDDISLAEALKSKLAFSREDDGPCILLESATEEKTISWRNPITGATDRASLKIILKMINSSIMGRRKEVSRYLEESAEAEILIFGKDEIGSTVLSMVAAECHPSMVSLFLDKGALVNSCNNTGRTSLMEAALWGRAENVEILLAGGANMEMEDRKGRKAIDFSRETEENKEERYNRSGRTHHVYKENAYEADRQRTAIERMLDIQADMSAPTQGPVNLEDLIYEFHSFSHSATTSEIVLSAPVAKFPVPSQRKTIARLERGNGFPAVHAMSGWAHLEGQHFTSGRSWTDKVFAICGLIGHPLQQHAYDGRERPGSWSACHAEKQLIAYFINMHVFLPNEIARKEEEDTGWEETDRREERSLPNLFDARPPVALKKAHILVSREICHDCQKFVQRAQKVLGLSFELKAC